MSRKTKSILALLVVILFSCLFYFRNYSNSIFKVENSNYEKNNEANANHSSSENDQNNNEASNNEEKKEKTFEIPKTETPKIKTAEEKAEVMSADRARMTSLGLYYDYANLTLPQVVQAYMKNNGISNNQVAFSYLNIETGELIEMNETQAMRAGSTYKLPLNMIIVDDLEARGLSMTEKYDITNTYYEYKGEHDKYVEVFDGEMTIPQMQYYSLVYSENTPAYALADRLGGMEEAYKLYSRYGESKSSEIKTFSNENYTTTNYYIQVLEQLWTHQEKYKDLIGYLEISFENDYYKTYLKNLQIAQKPGYVKEALNVDAIVHEKTPYLIALYTKGLGGTTTSSTEVSLVGMRQLGQLSYIINEWHRVNMN